VDRAAVVERNGLQRLVRVERGNVAADDVHIRRPALPVVIGDGLPDGRQIQARVAHSQKLAAGMLRLRAVSINSTISAADGSQSPCK